MIVINIQKLEIHNVILLFVLQHYKLIFLKVCDIAIKGLKNENNIFAQYYRRKRLFFEKNSSHGSHHHLLNWLYAKEVMSRSFYNHGLSINPKQ